MEVDAIIAWLDGKGIHPEWTTNLLAILAAGSQKNAIDDDSVSRIIEFARSMEDRRRMSDEQEWLDTSGWDEVKRNIGKK